MFHTSDIKLMASNVLFAVLLYSKLDGNTRFVEINNCNTVHDIK